LKGTKLWQSPGSPIIQGRSRRQRPAWQQWLPAVLVAALVAVALLYASSWPGGTPLHYAVAIAGVVLGAFLGVRLTRAMGWRFALLWGSVAGVLCAAVLVSVAAALFSA